MTGNYFRKTRKFYGCSHPDRFVKTQSRVKKSATGRAGREPCRVVVVEDTCVSEQGTTSIVERAKKYHVCGRSSALCDASELIRNPQPDVIALQIAGTLPQSDEGIR